MLSKYKNRAFIEKRIVTNGTTEGRVSCSVCCRPRCPPVISLL